MSGASISTAHSGSIDFAYDQHNEAELQYTAVQYILELALIDASNWPADSAECASDGDCRSSSHFGQMSNTSAAASTAAQCGLNGYVTDVHMPSA